MNTENNLTLPAYVSDLYAAYFSPFQSKIFMHRAYAFLSTFGFADKLHQAVIDELPFREKVLLLGAVGANFERRVADQIGEDGELTVADISKTRLDLCAEQTLGAANVRFEQKDVRTPFKKKYGTVIGLFLLHEMPDKSKKSVLRNALKAMKDDGRAIFIDYHTPSTYNMLKYPVRRFNRLFEPFAESLWDRSFQNFIPDASKYGWEKRFFCSGLYQMVIIRRKAVPSDK